jgi:hypothetical protein
LSASASPNQSAEIKNPRQARAHRGFSWLCSSAIRTASRAAGKELRPTGVDRNADPLWPVNWPEYTEQKRQRQESVPPRRSG